LNPPVRGCSAVEEPVGKLKDERPAVAGLVSFC
jgi:hypothetical protein